MANKILREPEELNRLNKIREQLLGTDRDDHLRILDEWEARIKKSLIKLSLQGNEGVQMLLAQAHREIHDINDILINAKPKRLTTAAALEYANDTIRLFDKKELWSWFIDFFQVAQKDINEARKFLDDQENPAAEMTEDWGGL